MTDEMLQTKLGDLAGAIGKIKNNPKSVSAKEEIRKTLNDIFMQPRENFNGGSEVRYSNTTGHNHDIVRDVLYTDNFDKMFFGVMVMPAMVADEVIKGVIEEDKVVIKQVYVELDSKLFDEALDLSIYEIAALIVREVAHMVADSSPMEQVKKDIDLYLFSTGQTLKLSDVSHYKEILSYGIRDAIRKSVSIFEISDRSKIVDSFDDELGIKEDLVSAMKKIDKNGYNWNRDIDNKLIFLSWVIRLYKDVIHKRIDAINDLGVAIKLTGSKIEKREMENIIARLSRIDDDSLLQEGALDYISDFFAKTRFDIKKNGMKKYEDDFFEIQFEINNMETQEEAMLLLHRINSRMAVLDDYLTSEDLSASDRKRWERLYSEYNKLRFNLSNNKIYTNKTRLYVNYGMDD